MGQMGNKQRTGRSGQRQPEVGRECDHFRETTACARDSVEPSRSSHSARDVSATIGADFFHSLVKHLANALSPYCIYIGELNKLSTHCRTLEVYVDGNHSPNFEFELAGTAAGEALCMGPRAHAAAVQSAFPSDSLLKQMGAESFVA